MTPQGRVGRSAAWRRLWIARNLGRGSVEITRSRVGLQDKTPSSSNVVGNSLTILQEELENAEAPFRIRDVGTHDNVVDRGVDLIS